MLGQEPAHKPAAGKAAVYRGTRHARIDRLDRQRTISGPFGGSLDVKASITGTANLRADVDLDVQYDSSGIAPAFIYVSNWEFLGARYAAYVAVPAMKNTHVGTIVALVLTLILIWLVPFLQIWVVFGAANQLMASLALLLVTLWLMEKGKSYQWTFWPFVFMFITTMGALFYKAYEAFFINLPKTGDPTANKIANVAEYTSAQVIIGITCLVLIVAAFILAWDGLKAIQRNRAKLAQARAKG